MFYGVHAFLSLFTLLHADGSFDNSVLSRLSHLWLVGAIKDCAAQPPWPRVFLIDENIGAAAELASSKVHGVLMSKTQKTSKEKYEIPIPKRGDFFSNLKKAAAPEKKSQSRGPKK